jgi:hypothetical protein
MCALDAYNPPSSKTLFNVEHNLLPFFYTLEDKSQLHRHLLAALAVSFTHFPILSQTSVAKCLGTAMYPGAIR